MIKWKKALKLAVVAIITIAILALLQNLLMPKYMTEILEGALISEYYLEENKDHDVIFIGDCEVYENFSVTLWQNMV